MFFIGLTLLACFLRWRGTLFEKRWLLWIFVVAVFGPFIANEVGWVSAEVGRQPWIVHPNVIRDAAGNPQFDAAGMVQYNLSEGLLTRNAVSEAIDGGQVLASIVMFSVIYALLFWVWLYVLNDKIQKGPKPVVIGGPHPQAGWSQQRLARCTRGRCPKRKIFSRRRRMRMDLHVIWFFLLGVLLAGYAVLDGFDLGVGILHLLAKTDHERRLFINSIGPIWDGNEVWLVVFGGACLRRFPRRTRPCSPAFIWRSCCCCSR